MKKEKIWPINYFVSYNPSREGSLVVKVQNFEINLIGCTKSKFA